MVGGLRAVCRMKKPVKEFGVVRRKGGFRKENGMIFSYEIIANQKKAGIEIIICQDGFDTI